MKWQFILWQWLIDYDFKTLFNAFLSLLATAAFAVYNGFLGIRYSSLWHGSISVYYLLLAVIRGAIILTEKLSSQKQAEKLRGYAYLGASVLLLLLNLCMVAPIALLVKQEKPVHLGMVPAIVMATYSFGKITMASINLVKRRKSANSLVRLLRSINFIDALMSIATLQNTLIMVAGTGDKKAMLPLTAVTSALLWLGTVFISVAGLVKRQNCV